MKMIVQHEWEVFSNNNKIAGGHVWVSPLCTSFVLLEKGHTFGIVDVHFCKMNKVRNSFTKNFLFPLFFYPVWLWHSP